MDIKYIVLLCVVAYAVGSVNFATLISSIKDKDIKKIGSGNPGTMNVLRSVGKVWGVLTFVLDSLKGASFALIGRFLINGSDNYFMAILLGFFVILGHIFPVYSGFKGGKGVASTIGVFISISPIAGSITLVVLILFLFVIKYGFIGSFLAVTAFASFAIYLCKDSIFGIIIICIWWALIIFAHRANIKRMIKGEENTLNIIGKNEVKEIEDKDSEDKQWN